MKKAMRKYWILILAVLLMQSEAQAQVQKHQKAQENPSVCVGLKGGVNMPGMSYWGNPALNRLPQDTLFSPMGGFFVEVPLNKTLLIAPEVVYVQRGTGLQYTHQSGSMVHYILKVHYVDFRLPVELRWPIRPYLQPYLTLGAELGMRLGGSIQMTRTAPISLNDSIPVGKANMGLLHAGAFAGAGLRSRLDVGGLGIVLKLSASYHQGLLDTYSSMEKEGSAQAGNVNAYQVVGMRLPRGLELCLGIAIPLEGRQRDACSAFANDRYRPKHSKGTLYGF